MNKGFLLLEVAVVLLVVFGSVAAFFFWRSGSQEAVLVRYEIDMVYSLCCALQQRAQLSTERIALVFDVAERKYSWPGGEHTLAEGVCISLGYSPIDDGNGFSFPHRQIVFYEDGGISPGSLVLKDVHESVWYAVRCGVSRPSVVRRYQRDLMVWKEIS